MRHESQTAKLLIQIMQSKTWWSIICWHENVRCFHCWATLSSSFWDWVNVDASREETKMQGRGPFHFWGSRQLTAWFVNRGYNTTSIRNTLVETMYHPSWESFESRHLTFSTTDLKSKVSRKNFVPDACYESGMIFFFMNKIMKKQ